MKYVIFFLVSVLLASCGHRDFVPNNGDILFCVAESSGMSDAIVDATKSRDSVQYDHVALFAVISGEAVVIEAAPKGGVIVSSFKEFLSNAPVVDGKPGITVMRILGNVDIEAAISRAQSFIGQPYDWSYLPDNNKMYCSELIYECYLKDDGSHIFAASPMSFRNSSGEIPQFWVDLFARMGEPIPEGVIGTNPNDMSRDSSLQEIHRYFRPASDI